MATKRKKVKAVEPEVVSSVEPEVAAVPMTMAAATPRANGQSTNGFAKVEQGKSYVLSVNAPHGPGEVELLAADSDTQSEPDMFSLLYTKVENSMQIPFVAVSSWVYVQAPNSSINWLVTPANFSLAVPGVSSGGGESFDPEAPQEESMYIRTIPLVAESGYATNDAVLPAEAPSGVYEVLIPNFGVQSTYTIVAYNQGSGNNRPDIIKTLEDCNQPLIYNGDYSDFSGWSYENETGGSTIAIPVGANVVRLSCYFQHVIGEATSLIKVSCNNGFTQGNTIGSIVVRQLA